MKLTFVFYDETENQIRLVKWKIGKHGYNITKSDIRAVVDELKKERYCERGTYDNLVAVLRGHVYRFVPSQEFSLDRVNGEV